MKNTITLCLAMLLASLQLNAQFTVETPDGNEFTEGEVFTFGALTEPDAYLEFLVTNTSDADINARIEFVSATNADGSEMQICFGLCYTGTSIGQSYPINDVVVIEPGQTQTSTGDHFFNTSDGNGSIIDYSFRFYTVDDNDNEIGDDLTIVYRFDPALSVEETTLVNASLMRTTVTDLLEIDANEPAQLAIYDLQGRLVKNETLSTGRSAINVSDLASQAYIAVISNNAGGSQSTKIIIR